MSVATTLRGLLDNQVAKFTYVKNNGEVRHATGTRNRELIPTACRPRWDIIDRNSEKAVVYFDFDESNFRSISVDANTF